VGPLLVTPPLSRFLLSTTPVLFARFRPHCSMLRDLSRPSVLASAGLFSAKRWGIPFISVTPDMPKRPRHDEIRAWLKKHPQVTRFVVIDDEDDGLDDLPLFQPSATTGLTGEIVRSVVQYLDGKTDKDVRSSRVERLLQNVQSAIKGHPG
jgi:hypothetical protein